MYKAGDKFEIVGSKYLGDYWRAGNIVEFVKPYENLDGVYSFKEPGRADGYFLNFGIEGETHFHSTVRPLRTEAEKRGAKFGVMGVVKGTSLVKYAIGKKILFVCAAQTVALEEVWHCVIEGETETTTFFPSNIRLDHEPEYKEIPFSEGTHEQRMDAGNLWHDGSPVVQISHFAGSGYAFTIKGDFEIRTNTKSLTIRIPT